MPRPRVVVVGGGLAGVAAALDAVDSGAAVTLIERRTHLGGLTWSFRHNGLWFDNGQHVFMRCCVAYQGFLERIAASDRVYVQPRLDVAVVAPGGRQENIRRSGLPAPLHLGRSLARYGHLSVRERLRLGRAVAALRRVDPDAAASDDVTFGQWLRAHGQNTEAIENLWDLITRPTLNVGADRASLGLAAFVFRTGLLEHTDAADIGWSLVPLGELHGDSSARALAAAGVDVVLDTRVERIEPGPIVVAGPNRQTRAVPDERIDADAVIVALPHDTTARLLPDGALLQHARLLEMGMSPIVNVHLVFDRHLTDLPFAAAVGSPVEYVFDRTEASGLSSGQYLAVSLSAADAHMGTRPDALIRAMASALGELFPHAARASLVDGLVTRERNATFAAVPGTRALRPQPDTREPGVFVAGAWTDTGWPATMEGAVRSGTAAARAALAHLVPNRHIVEEVAS
ncbi:MAG: hydroxysqualene dehydroxylase HpnE [Acidimicrobiales bacterium]